MNKTLRRLGLIAGLLFGLAGRANADLIYTLSTDSKGDSATADFKLVTGGIEVIVTNTGSSVKTDAANAISQVSFTINPTLVGLATAFTELSGDEITYASHSSTGVNQGFKDYTPPSTDPHLHWGFSTSGGNTVNLVDVSGGGLTGPGGSPHELIVPLNATTGSNSLAQHTPDFNGTANFYLAVPNLPTELTSDDITGVKFSFGTTPEDLLASAGSPSGDSIMPFVIPEPATIFMTGLGLGAIGLIRFVRKAKKA